MSDLDTLRQELAELQAQHAALQGLMVQLVHASGELAGGFAALLVHLADEPDAQERARAVLAPASSRLMGLFDEIGARQPGATIN